MRLARLEVEVQTDHWGRVEWAHDIELYDTTARTAAAVMFVQCSSASSILMIPMDSKLDHS